MNDAELKRITDYLDFDHETFVGYVDNAPHATERDGGHAWKSGSGSEGERRVLYALVRMLKPEYVVELGTSFGASTTQLAAGVKANGNGRVDTVDSEKLIFGVHPVGRFIKTAVRDAVGHVNADAVTWLQRASTPIDFVFEDTDHTADTTQAIYDAALPRLREGGVIVSHDAANHFGDDVIAGIRASGADPIVVRVDDHACGFAIYRKPVAPKKTTRKRKSTRKKSDATTD